MLFVFRRIFVTTTRWAMSNEGAQQKVRSDSEKRYRLVERPISKKTTAAVAALTACIV
jgi:hypothetical protein